VAGLFRLTGSYEAVKRHMKWQTVGAAYDTSSDSIKSAYADWSTEPGVIPSKYDFWLALNEAAHWLSRSDRFTNFLGQPETALTATGSGAETESLDDFTPSYFISYEDAWRLYVWWVAHNVAVDRRELPWTLSELAAQNEEFLSPLFDSTEMSMHRRPSGDVELGNGPHGNYFEKPWSVYQGENIIGTPRFTYRFLVQSGLVGGNRLASIEALLGWSRSNLRHFEGAGTRANAQLHWGHRYFPTVEKIVNGTIRTGDTELRHWTHGCHGSSFFYKDVLRALNIPVRVPYICDHAEVYFFSEGLFMDHADNPYNTNFKSSQCSTSHLLLDAGTFAARFGRQLIHADPEICDPETDPVGIQVTPESIATCQ
jgi:hypothetical protein